VGFNFIDCDRDQQFKLPQDVRDWLPPDHLCWKVLEVVGRIDLSGFMSGYRSDGQGRAAYHPATMLSLVLYCYAKGIRSSRCIEEACIDDVGCRIITANHKVDHSTISRFIRRHQIPLKGILIQSLSLCAQQGLIDLTAVAIDGSPMEANSSRASNRTLQRLESIIAECKAGIENLLQQFPEPEEDHGAEMGDSSVAQLSRLSGRLIRANSARSKLHERAMPSAGEIKIKVDAAVRMVDRTQQRLSAETNKHRARLDGHARRTAEDQAAGLRGRMDVHRFHWTRRQLSCDNALGLPGPSLGWSEHEPPGRFLPRELGHRLLIQTPDLCSVSRAGISRDTTCRLPVASIN
jgi:transposase